MRPTAWSLASALVVCLATVTPGTTTAQAPSIPSSDNAALRYWMAMAELRDVPTDATRSARLDAIVEGRAGWDETNLGPLVEANEPALRTLRRGVTLASCDWGLDWDLGPHTPVAHLPKARVLGRLAALAALRAHSRGDAALAVELWRTGVIFSTHVARDGSLVSVLTARAILAAQLRTARYAVQTASLAASDAERLRASLSTLPVGAFAWDIAMDREAAGVGRLMRQLRESRDRRSTYRTLTGDDLPAGQPIPSDKELQSYMAFMTDLAAALRTAPAAAGAQVRPLEDTRNGLQPLLRDLVPVVARIIDARTTLEADRLAVLAALAPRSAP
jgi:hypothetical protein